MAKNENTRSEVIEAARSEFISHGFDGARLQTIADHTGVTKAMIHYYFKTKQHLFEEVFKESVTTVFHGIPEILESDVPLIQKLEHLIDQCLQIAEQRADQLAFVVTESKRKTDSLIPLFRDLYETEITLFERQLHRSAENYEIARVDVRHVLLNIFSLCFYPVLSSEISHVMLGMDSGEQVEDLRESRKGVVLDTILNWLTA